jgi:hypothetical protein
METKQFSKIPFENRKNCQYQIVVCVAGNQRCSVTRPISYMWGWKKEGRDDVCSAFFARNEWRSLGSFKGKNHQK